MTNIDSNISIVQTKARAFKDMHRPGSALLLPNAWDAWSARIFEDAGFPAIGTTSAGVAYARGYGDGQQMSRDEMAAEIACIVSVVDVPVTADVEAGYGPDPEDVAMTVKAVIAAGAVGVNLEDGTGEPENPLYSQEAHAQRVAAAREEADCAGISVVLNARTDTYLARVGDAESRFEETVRRANAYLEAGADCVFVPGVIDRTTVEALVRAIPGPLNVMAVPGALSAPEFFEIGVTRVSIGPSATLAAMGFVQQIARELREDGTYTTIERSFYGHAGAEQLMAGAQRRR